VEEIKMAKPSPQPAGRRPVPKIGLVVHSIGAFNPRAKDDAEKAIRRHFDGLIASGEIDPGSIITKRIFDPHEALAAADRFAEARVDLAVIANVAFPNGQVYLTLAAHPHLARVPLAVVAEPEPAGPEWETNAWCGVIMNNHVARQMGRPMAALPGPFDGDAFRTSFSRLLRVAGTIRFLRRDLVCRFGDAPSGFHSATGDQLAFAKVFGTRVETVDLTAVMDAYRTGRAKGYLGEAAFSDDDVKKTVKQLAEGRQVQVDPPMLERGARLYHAYRAIIRANGYTSAAFRCWPENNEPFIGVSACLAMGLLMGNGELTAAACESDWPTAVAQSIGTLLSGKPAACLDWVNHTGGSDVVQLGHCGMGICGSMASGEAHGAVCDAIALHPVIRQAGAAMGPVLVGQFAYGPKTGLCLTRDPDGSFKLLAFMGESAPETARGMTYSAADIRVADYAKLDRLVLEGGFPHHLAVAMGDIREDVRMLCAFLGLEYVSPHDGGGKDA
jgi:L-fucose isomerase-like protein